MPRTDHYKWNSSDLLGGGAFGRVFKVRKNYLELLTVLFRYC